MAQWPQVAPRVPRHDDGRTIMNQVKNLQGHGEFIEIPNFEAMLNPHPHYAALAAKGPVVRLRTHLGVEVYGVTQWDMAIAVLRDIRLSKSSANMQNALKKSGLSGPGSAFPTSGAYAAIFL